MDLGGFCWLSAEVHCTKQEQLFQSWSTKHWEFSAHASYYQMPVTPSWRSKGVPHWFHILFPLETEPSRDSKHCPRAVCSAWPVASPGPYGPPRALTALGITLAGNTAQKMPFFGAVCRSWTRCNRLLCYCRDAATCSIHVCSRGVLWLPK